MMKGKLFLVCLLTCVVATAGSASAHFGMVIPSDQMVMQGDDRNVKVDLLFWHPFEGIGKPEPLKHEFSGFWSRRITEEHRLVYAVKKGQIRIAQARYHY